MSAFNKFNQYVLDLATGVHNLNANTLKIMLTDSAPAPTARVKADVVEIPAGNGYTAGGGVAAFVSGGDIAGLYRLILSPVSFLAAGGSIAQFRYSVLYNSTPAAGPLIGFWDFGAELNLTNGNTLTVALDPTNGVLTLQ